MLYQVLATYSGVHSRAEKGSMVLEKVVEAVTTRDKGMKTY